MRYQDQIIRLTQQQAESFIKNIRAIPEDKLNWSVEGAGRTPMDMLQEIAQAPGFAIPMLTNKACPPFDPESWGKAMEARKAWVTVDQCEAIMNENLEKLYAVIKDYPDADLPFEIDLPFVEGLRQSMADIMAYPYWNLSYHLGQICFVQILYGDKEMH